MQQVSRRNVLFSIAALASTPLLGSPRMLAAPLEDIEGSTWNLQPLYQDDADWDKARLQLSRHIPQLTGYKGTATKSGPALAEAYLAISDATRAAQRIITYAQLRADSDLRDAAAQEMRQRALGLQDQLNEATAWLDPAVLALGRTKVDSFIVTTPSLGSFRFHLDDLFRQSSHTLSAEAEALLAMVQLPLAGPQSINRVLTNTELPAPPVVLASGEIYKGGARPLVDFSRDDRRRIYDGYYARYSAFEETLGATLNSALLGDAFRAKARHYKNSLEEALFEPNIPEAVYTTLIAEANRGLPVLHRYYDLQRRAAKVEQAHLYDLVRPLATSSRSFTLPEMRSITLEALAPLGQAYVEQLRGAFAARWMDAFPRTGKAPGSVTTAGAYDVHPYLLLNLTPSYDSLTLFAHEWGHAMHNTLARTSQPFETFYAPVFLEEIGSTCNEQLLISHLIATAKNDEERRFYLCQQMRVLATVFFQNALSAEFEAKMHERVEGGAALSGKDFSGAFLDLMTRFYGPSVVVDPVYGIKWAQNDQFFTPFYQFQYCTSLTAAVYFSQSVLGGGARDRDRYLSVLKAGGSGYGYGILRSAGLDLAEAAPYEALFTLFSQTMDSFEALSRA